MGKLADMIEQKKQEFVEETLRLADKLLEDVASTIVQNADYDNWGVWETKSLYNVQAVNMVIRELNEEGFKAVMCQTGGTRTLFFVRGGGKVETEGGTTIICGDRGILRS